MDDDMILSEKQIGELLSCQDDKLEKIKCNNCGIIHKVPCPNTNFNYCSACGTKFEIEPEHDPWLWEGCMCYIAVLDMVMFFSRLDDKSTPCFVHRKIEIGNKEKEQIHALYHTTSTPLDFAPNWATHIDIGAEGDFRFTIPDEKTSIGNMFPKSSTKWLPWRNCPEHLLNTILPIPDWARNGGTV